MITQNKARPALPKSYTLTLPAGGAFPEYFLFKYGRINFEWFQHPMAMPGEAGGAHPKILEKPFVT